MNNSKHSDYDLIVMLKSKDENALSLIYDQYAPCLYGLLVKKVQDEMLAADILQKTFSKIWKECAEIDSVKNRLFTWLIASVHKTALSEYKINLTATTQQNNAVYSFEPLVPQLYPVYAQVSI